MDDAEQLTESVDQLKNRLRWLTISINLLVSFAFLSAFCLDIIVHTAVPSLTQMYDEMLAGQPLPLVSSFVMATTHFSLSLDFVLGAILIILGTSRWRHLLPPIGSVATVMILIKITVTIYAMMLPFIQLINSLGGGY